MRVYMLLFTLLLLIPLCHADGMMHVKTYDEASFQLAEEDGQLSFIRMQNNTQHMLLSIGAELTGEEAVWLYPIPARPSQVNLGMQDTAPLLRGDDISQEAQESLEGSFRTALLWQTLMPGWFGKAGYRKQEALDGEANQGVQVHQQLEQYGVHTELVTAKSVGALSAYLEKQNASLPDESSQVLDSYIGTNTSFVVSWIENVTRFSRQQPVRYVYSLLKSGNVDRARSFLNRTNMSRTGSPENRQEALQYRRYDVLQDMAEALEEPRNEEKLDRAKNNLRELQEFMRGPWGSQRSPMVSVSVSFPTEDVYYPLKPTSVYGNTTVPATIYIKGLIDPTIYQNLRPHAQVEHYVNENPENAGNFSEDGRLLYTRISLDAPADAYTQDLSFPPRPARGQQRQLAVPALAPWLAMLCYLGASLFAAWAAARFVLYRPQGWRAALFGLTNLLGVSGVIFAQFFLRTKEHATASMPMRWKRHLTIAAIYTLLGIGVLSLEFLPYDATGFVGFCEDYLYEFLMGYFALLWLGVMLLPVLIGHRQSHTRVIDVKQLAFYGVMIAGGLMIFIRMFYDPLEQLPVLLALSLPLFFLLLIPFDMLTSRFCPGRWLYPVACDTRKSLFTLCFVLLFNAVLLLPLVLTWLLW